MLGRLLRRAAKRPLPIERVRPDYILWDGLRQGWGMAVMWHRGFEPGHTGEKGGSISGFDPVRNPRVGDVFYTDMQSGKRLLWIVDKVEGKYDPPDMYHAEISVIGYAEDNPLPESAWIEPEVVWLRGG